MNNLDKVKLQSKFDKQSKISVEEANIVNYWHVKFKEAMVHKAKETKEWHDYWEAYNGDYFKNTSNSQMENASGVHCEHPAFAPESFGLSNILMRMYRAFIVLLRLITSTGCGGFFSFKAFS